MPQHEHLKEKRKRKKKKKKDPTTLRPRGALAER
jgi:hypothetical protein